MKSNLGIMKLVYPPVSNQEAEWFKEDPEVRDLLKESHLYAIVQRYEANFEFDYAAIEAGIIPESVQVGVYAGEAHVEGFIDILKLCEVRGKQFKDMCIEIELGPKLFRMYEINEQTRERIDVVAWFTVEKLLYDFWRGHPGLKGFENYRELTTYKLHYVGISKKEDSLTRLVVRPHDKRIRVLSNESPMSEWARLTDEIILMFFKVEALQINIFEFEEIDEFMKATDEIDQIKLIADAEKALVSILDSKYNTEKYNNYPRGKDGLYDLGIDRYGYILGEDITLATETESMYGEHVNSVKLPRKTDLIIVHDDEVKFVKFNEETN